MTSLLVVISVIVLVGYHVSDLVVESDVSYELAERVRQLEAICRDLVSRPKGVESHSYSDYKCEYGE